MKILLLVDSYIPVAQAAAVMMHDLAKEIKSRGHDVTVITPTPSINKPMHREDIDGINIIRVKTPDFKNINRSSVNPISRKLANIKRGFTESKLSQAIWNSAAGYLQGSKHDLIIYYSPSIFFGDLVCKLKHIWDCPSYLILRDIFPQWLVDAGEISPVHPGLWYLRHKENINYAAADTIAVQSPANLKYFSNKDGNYNLEVLYNWTDNTRRRKSTGSYRKKFGYTDNDVVFFFGGTFTEAQDMPNLLRLAKNLQDTPSAKFLFIGKGAKYKELETAISSGSHANVTLHPAVDHDTFLDIMADIDIGLITLGAHLKTHNIPGKLLDYLVFGKPVLASLNPGNDLADILEKSGAGIATINGDDFRLAEAARTLTANNTKRADLSRSALKLQKETFSVQNAADQILLKINPASE